MSEPTQPPTPVEVRAPEGGRVLEIDWDNGTTSRFRHRDLRAFCPCAGCQGHQGPIRRIDIEGGDSGLELTELSEVGNYGLQLSWGDGHATGIYSFAYFQDLGALYDADDETRATTVFGR